MRGGDGDRAAAGDRGRPLGGARSAIQFFRWDGLYRGLPFIPLWVRLVASGCFWQIV